MEVQRLQECRKDCHKGFVYVQRAASGGTSCCSPLQFEKPAFGADGRNIWKRKDWTRSPQNGFIYKIKAEEATYG